MRVLLLTRYGRLGASSRVRFLQYTPALELEGWQIDVAPLFSNKYILASYNGEGLWRETVAGFWGRIKALLSVRRYDVIWIEKEIFPFLSAGAERLLVALRVPYVVDYDDAVFHTYDRHQSLVVRAVLGRKIDTVMRHASVVIVGNEYLAGRARSAGARRIELIPTVVDTQRYTVRAARHEDSTPVIGWIGSPATSGYLLNMTSVFESIKRQFNVRFVAVGATEEAVRDSPIEAWLWTEESEVRSIQLFDIGIMPLTNEPWDSGKCGYKLIQYMACGVPVVGSPVGINRQIVDHGVNGLLASGASAWRRALKDLILDPGKRERMGLRGRERVEQRYSVDVYVPRIRSILLASRG